MGLREISSVLMEGNRCAAAARLYSPLRFINPKMDARRQAANAQTHRGATSLSSATAVRLVHVPEKPLKWVRSRVPRRDHLSFPYFSFNTQEALLLIKHVIASALGRGRLQRSEKPRKFFRKSRWKDARGGRGEEGGWVRWLPETLQKPCWDPLFHKTADREGLASRRTAPAA